MTLPVRAVRPSHQPSTSTTHTVEKKKEDKDF